jgi:hypothetical protein
LVTAIVGTADRSLRWTDAFGLPIDAGRPRTAFLADAADAYVTRRRLLTSISRRHMENVMMAGPFRFSRRFQRRVAVSLRHSVAAEDRPRGAMRGFPLPRRPGVATECVMHGTARRRPGCATRQQIPLAFGSDAHG